MGKMIENPKTKRSFGMSRRTFLKTAMATSVLPLIYGCQTAGEENGSGLIDANGTELFYTQIGSGEPIMIMHGGLGLDHEYFRPFMDGLQDSAQLTYFDHRGNGRSQEQADWSSVDFDTFAKDADDLRAALGFDKIILLGHSYGGFIAQEYAARYPENLKGLILSNTSPNVIDYAPEMPEWATEEAMGAFGALFSGPFESDEQWGETWSTAVQLYWKDMDAEVARELHERTNYRAAAWNHAGPLLGSYQMKGRLAAIDVPTLVLGGRFDFITPPAAQEDLDAELPNSQLTIFEDSAHFPFITEQDAYLSTVRDWVSSL